MDGRNKRRESRRAKIRENLADQPAVMLRDIADEYDVHRDTAKADLDALVEKMDDLHHVQAAGGQHVYVLVDSTDSEAGPVTEMEAHVRDHWVTRQGGQALLIGLGLTLVVLIFSMVTNVLWAWDVSWATAVRTVTSLLGWIAIIFVFSGIFFLWWADSLRP